MIVNLLFGIFNRLENFVCKIDFQEENERSSELHCYDGIAGSTNPTLYFHVNDSLYHFWFNIHVQTSKNCREVLQYFNRKLFYDQN